MMKLNKLCQHLEREFDEKLTRTLHGLKHVYHNQREVQRILKTENPVIYERFIAKSGKVKYGLTVINPGTIGKEFHMTHGHKHKKSSAELCALVHGKGKLIIQDKQPKIIDLKPNKPVIIPKNSAHRLVNIGNKKLKVLTVNNPKPDHDYLVDFKKRIFTK